MPRSENILTDESAAGISNTTNGSTIEYDPANIIEHILTDEARDAGAQSDEEIEKYKQAKRKIEEYNYRQRNIDIRWIEINNERKLDINVHMYSNRSSVETFYNEVPNKDQLHERHLEVDVDGDIDTEDMVGACDNCGDILCMEKLITLRDSDHMWCEECINENAHRCDNCGNYFEYSDDFEEVFRDYDHYEGYWCEDCQREAGAWWDDDDERMYIEKGGKMQKFLHPEGILARGSINCPECQDSTDGWCPRHLKEKIKEMEAEATTLWVYDKIRRDYHTSEHKRFKSLRLRMPNEHPYLYYGIELEVLWNRGKGDYDKVTTEFIEATNGMFVAEYDRSVDERGNCLGNYIGAEFISRPTSYKRWTNKEHITLLKKGLEVLKKYGAINDEGCGLHVHMSKVFFEKNTKKKVREIKSDMDWFFQYFQPEIEKISRRPYTQYCASKAFRMQNSVDNFRNENVMFGVKGKFMMEPGELTVSRGSGITHHDCIIETPKTIEARTFKSTIIAEEILATIEFCRGLAHAARYRTGLAGKTFGDIMLTKDSPYLLEYIRKLKLDTSRELKKKLEVKI